MSGNTLSQLRIPEGFRFGYEQHVRAGRIEHLWFLANEAGGVHVSAWPTKPAYEGDRDRWLGGVECHSPTSLYGQEKPSHEHCWLLGAPCWHDGSSLQFSEQIAPHMPEHEVMEKYHHARVLSILIHRHRVWLTEREDA